MRSVLFVLFFAFAFVFVAAAPVEQHQVRRYYADEGINSVSFEKREEDIEADADVAKRGLFDFFANAGSSFTTNLLNIFKSLFNWNGSVSSGSGSSGSTTTTGGTTTPTTTAAAAAPDATDDDYCDDGDSADTPSALTSTGNSCPYWWSCLFVIS